MNPSPDIADHPARILIVDDERHNRQLLEVMLTPEGFRPPDRCQRRGSARHGGAATARPDPARHHDAGHGRVPGGGQDQGQPRHQEHSRHHGHRPGRSQRQDARAERRSRGLSHQARGSCRAVRAGEEPVAPQGLRRLSRQVQPDARRRGGLAHGRPGRERASLPIDIRRGAGRDRARGPGRAMAAGQSAPLRSPGILARGAAKSRRSGAHAAGRSGRRGRVVPSDGRGNAGPPRGRRKAISTARRQLRVGQGQHVRPSRRRRVSPSISSRSSRTSPNGGRSKRRSGRRTRWTRSGDWRRASPTISTIC